MKAIPLAVTSTKYFHKFSVMTTQYTALKLLALLLAALEVVG
jgi:hypothetical protein